MGSAADPTWRGWSLLSIQFIYLSAQAHSFIDRYDPEWNLICLHDDAFAGGEDHRYLMHMLEEIQERGVHKPKPSRNALSQTFLTWLSTLPLVSRLLPPRPAPQQKMSVQRITSTSAKESPWDTLIDSIQAVLDDMGTPGL